ncbi:MAG: hypothetical protein DRR11_02285 [Gammaproteobacteria bacterium]|nr:MAG: hypothetical protein DRR11_02285 [Gammaproteobacteria bacterium]RLA37756.1 MAG: hypothetical protein DRR15_01180 [Gammaproteobacteria bacterium]
MVAGLLLPLTTVFADSADWTIAIGKDSSPYETIASLQQDSLTTIKDEYAKQDLRPQLEFRCTAGEMAITARIDWQRFISSFSTELGFKVDGGRFTWLKWKVDQSNKVTFSPSAADSQKLIELALGGEKLLVEVTPYSASPVTVEYDLEGFSGALAELKDRCSQ